MPDLSNYTDDELRQIAGVTPAISSMSDDDLMKIANQPAVEVDAPDMPIISANDIEERFNLIRQFAGPNIEKKARDAASIAATYNIPESTAFDLRDSFLQRMDTTNLWDKATGSFKAGWGDVYSSIGGIMKRKGLAAGDAYVDFGERLKRAYIPASDQSEFTWRKMKDPEWYATTIMRSVPFTISLIPAAIVGAYSAVTAGGAIGLGLFGKTVLGAIGGAALSRPIESAFEAQGAYEEAKGKGFTDDNSEIAANQVFWDNMKLSGLDAAEFATAFLPMGKIVGSTVKRALGKRILAATGKTSAKLGAVGAMEMMEERYQEKSVMDATGDFVSLFDFDNPRLNEAGAAGAVFGVGLGGAGSVWTAVKDKVTESPDQKTKFIYDRAKKQAIDNGLSESEADIVALDAIAATPEGKSHIESVIGDLVDLANGKPAKEKITTETGKSDQPFIFGVQEDANGEVTGFTMADPVTGQTFDVPAQRSEDRDTLNVTPDMQAVNAKLQEIRSADETDAFLDRIIEGKEDIDEAAGQLFQDDIDEMGFVNEVFTEEDAKPETVLDRVKQINDKLGEKGSIDLTPLVDLGRSIWAEGHQTIEAFTARAKELLSDVWDKVQYHIQAAWSILNNERGSVNIGDVTKDKGTANIPAKDKPQAEAGFTKVFRGEYQGNKKGNYYSPDVEFARQFTQSGLDKEIIEGFIKNKDIYRPKEDVYAGDPDAIEGIVQEAKNNGFKAVELSEGDGQPKSIYIIDKSAVKSTKQYTEKGTADIPAKTTPQADAGNPNFVKSISHIETGDAFTAKMYHGSPDARFSEEFNPNKKGYYSGDRNALPDNKSWIELYGKTGGGFRKKSVTGNIGVSFTDNYGTAKSYADKPAFDYQNSIPMVLERYVTLHNPKVFNLHGREWNLELGKEIEKAISEGHDGIVFKNIKDNYHPSDSKKATNNIIAFNTEQISRELPNPSRPPEVGGQTLYSGVDPTQIIPVLKSLTENLKEAWPHLEALGLKAYESGKSTFEAWSGEMKSYLGDLWESFKGAMSQIWESVKAINKQIGERGSFSTKKRVSEYDVDDVNELLDMAARQDRASGEMPESPTYDAVRKKAAEMAWDKISKKIDFQKRRENSAMRKQAMDDARTLPAFQSMSYIIENGGLDRSKLLNDYGKETVDELSTRRIGLVRDGGTLEHDVVADQMGYGSGDEMINDILDWRGLETEAKKRAEEFEYRYSDLITSAELDNFNELLIAEEDKIMSKLTAENRPKPAKGLKTFIRQKTGQAQPKDRLVTEYDALAEAFRKEARTAREAFRAGKKGEVEKSKEKMRWLMRRRESLKNVRDYFGLTDAELMSATKRRNVGLMDDAEFKQFLRNVELKAVELAETRQEKMALLKLIEEKRLKKVDNYRQALELPTFNDMTAQQLRDFAKLLEPFQEDDVFLTQRELETVDRTDLRGIKTLREARERLAKEAGVDVEELNKVHVEALDSFRWDSALRERDPFYDIMVSRMTEAYLGAELRAHDVESKVYELARKSEKSRDRSLVGRMIPQDDLIMAFLESPPDRKAAIVEQMTPEQIDYANYMQAYFADALNYLIATKSLERGRENYFVHIRRSFLENLKDGGMKKAISELFKTYQQDQLVFNILDDDTGNILPLEKFFQFSLQRTDTMDPTRNVTKAFLTYVNTFERKKMFDAIIPKLDIYAQSLTPTRYTPRGLEIDRSLKTYVNKWINNKKGRKISFDSVLRQGGPIDVGIRALRTFTTILDLGLSPIAQAAAVIGEQVANTAMLGTRGMATGTARMRTDKGKRILDKYEAWVGRSIWEEFTAPGKEITERMSQALFAGFDLATKTANKQFLLASMTEQEFEAEEISTERLAEMRLDMGRFRVVPGTGSLVGSTSAGDAAMQYKKWAVPIARTLIADAETLIGNIKAGQPLDARAGKELMRFAYMSAAVFIVGAMAGADEDDRSVIGKAKGRLYREAMTLMQGIDPTLWLATPRTLTWLYQTAQAFKSMVLMETYKSGDKEGELKGDDKLKRQFVPGVVRSVASED